MACLLALYEIEDAYNRYGRVWIYVVVTDSAYLVDALTMHIYRWRRNGFRNANG